MNEILELEKSKRAAAKTTPPRIATKSRISRRSVTFFGPLSVLAENVADTK